MATPSNSFAWGLTFSSGGVINGDINPAFSGQRSLERASFSFSSLSLVIVSPPRREGKGGKGSRSADTRAIAWALHVPSLYGGPRGSAPLCPHSYRDPYTPNRSGEGETDSPDARAPTCPPTWHLLLSPPANFTRDSTLFRERYLKSVIERRAEQATRASHEKDFHRDPSIFVVSSSLLQELVVV